MKHRLVFLAVVAVTLSLLAAGAPGVAQALTPAQCEFFASNGKVSICHRTQSARTPYIPILVSVEACMAGHADHPGDYIGFNDPMCQGLACLPANAPADGTIECCEGLVPRDGVCVERSDVCVPGGFPEGVAPCCSGSSANGVCL